MATAQLRPLSIGEILDAALKVVIRHWKPLSLTVIPAVLPLTILSVLLTASMDVETALDTFERTGDPADIPTEFWVSGGVGTVVTFLMSAIVTAVCFKAVADAWLGAEPSVGRSWKFVLPRALPLIVMFVVSSIAAALGLLLCVIPGVFLYVMWSLSTATLLFERVGPFKALARSFQLVKQRFWATLLLLFVVLLLVFFVGAIVQGIPSALITLFAADNEIAIAVSDVIFGTLGNAIVLPISAAAMTILYFDQRVRKEGFDVQLLAQGIGTAYDPNAPIPAPLQPVGGYAPPPPGWGEQQPGGWNPPPPQQYGGGWSAPAHDAPLRWGPAAGPPQDTRPPEDSPWMAPGGSPSPGGWAPPAGAAPERRWSPAPDEDTAPLPAEWPGRDDDTARLPAGDDESPTGGAAPPTGDDPASRWGAPSPRDDAPPAGDDSAPRDDVPPAGDDDSASRWGPSSPFGESPWDEDSKRKRDDKDWQPPEEPRGPGGL